MREIKFRWFNLEEKKFNYFDFLFTCDVKRFANDKEFSYIETLQQYTGLKDKNGKEIYEGDILHEFKEKTAPMANNGINRKFVVDDIRELEFSPLNCEVIGNIFENPELIN